MESSAMIPFNNLSIKIEILYDAQNKPWFKKVDVGGFFGLKNIHNVTSKFGIEDKIIRGEITVWPSHGSYTPRKHAQWFYICKWCNHRT